MGVQKITFDGSSVSASQDAEINHFLCGNVEAGVIKGLRSGITYSVANSYITVNSGYVQIYGRRVFIEDATKVYVSLDSIKIGYVILDINIQHNTAVVTRIEGTSTTPPTLIQENLFYNGKRYQFPLVKYLKTTSSIEFMSFERSTISTSLEVANNSYNKAVEYVNNRVDLKIIRSPSQTSGNTFYLDVSNINIVDALFCIEISSKYITIPGWHMINHSVFGFSTTVYGVDVDISGELSGSTLLLTTDNSAIDVKSACVYKFGG